MTTQAIFNNGIRCKGKGFNCNGCRDKFDCVEYVNTDVKEKPPLGLIPKNIWLQQRFKDVTEAINRYYEAKLTVPVEWIEEYAELINLITD